MSTSIWGVDGKAREKKPSEPGDSHSLSGGLRYCVWWDCIITIIADSKISANLDEKVRKSALKLNDGSKLLSTGISFLNPLVLYFDLLWLLQWHHSEQSLPYTLLNILPLGPHFKCAVLNSYLYLFDLMYETSVLEGQTQLRYKPGLLTLKLMQVLSACIQSRSSLKKLDLYFLFPCDGFSFYVTS